MKTEDSLRRQLDRSGDFSAELFLPVKAEIIRFYKNDAGTNFLVQLTADRTKDLFGDFLRSAQGKALQKGTPYVTIGQVRDGSRIGLWPSDSNPDLEGFAEAALSRFDAYLDSWGHWPSFQHFLGAAAGADLDPKAGQETQRPLDYFWLVGNLGIGGAIIDITLDEGVGIFVRPENGVLPVYASELAAELSAEAYSRRYGLNLRALKTPCLGCYLHGAAVSTEQGTIGYGLLEDQWPIHFLTCAQIGCAQHPNLDEVRHFRIVDNGRWYDLRGCESHGQHPRWFAI